MVWLSGAELTPLDATAGARAYMAPERTCRMNRSIDSRSDLHSVDVTLDEVATGALPFQASDSLGLQLVRDLAEQLRRTFSVTREGGTTFTIEFDDAASRA